MRTRRAGGRGGAIEVVLLTVPGVCASGGCSADDAEPLRDAGSSDVGASDSQLTPQDSGSVDMYVADASDRRCPLGQFWDGLNCNELAGCTIFAIRGNPDEGCVFFPDTTHVGP